MTGKTDQILELLFGTQRLEEVSVSDLKDLLEEFPSFNAVHYFLSKKLKTESSEDFLPETQKTALYFTNPFWLQWLLEAPQPVDSIEPVEEETVAITDSEATDTAGSEGSVWHEKNADEPAAVSYFGESIIKQEELKAEEPVPSFTSEPVHLSEDHSYSGEQADDLSSDSNYIIDEEDARIVSEEETESAREAYASEVMVPENIVSAENENSNGSAVETIGDHGLTVQEPGAFREEAVPDLHEETASAEQVETPDLMAPAEPIQENLAEAEPETVGQPLSPEEEKKSRPAFFWEKEFPATADSPASEVAEQEEVPVAQIPELPTQKLDNPAFLLAEDEPFAEYQGEQVEESVHPDPGIADFKKEEPESRVFFEHDPAIWDPAPVLHAPEAEHAPVPLMNEYVTEIPVAETTVKEEPPVHEETLPYKEEIMSPVAEAGPQPKTEAITEAAAGDELTFTPYHTIDYFASQGIYFIQEENPSDKFGKQLKSFTAWLKTMKRLPQTLLATDLSATTEAIIQDIAEHSIEEKEILTEAMAEVLILQGQKQKAIDILQKLSLLNPPKSAYFAARIEQIKAN